MSNSSTPHEQGALATGIEVAGLVVGFIAGTGLS
jgi:hypothetical protein